MAFSVGSEKNAGFSTINSLVLSVTVSEYLKKKNHLFRRRSKVPSPSRMEKIAEVRPKVVTLNIDNYLHGKFVAREKISRLTFLTTNG